MFILHVDPGVKPRQTILIHSSYIYIFTQRKHTIGTLMDDETNLSWVTTTTTVKYPVIIEVSDREDKLFSATRTAASLTCTKDDHQVHPRSHPCHLQTRHVQSLHP